MSLPRWIILAAVLALVAFVVAPTEAGELMEQAKQSWSIFTDGLQK